MSKSVTPIRGSRLISQRKCLVPVDPTHTPTIPARIWHCRQFNQYLEALEAFWIQNFVAFDNQEQRSLVHSVRNGVVDYQSRLSSYFEHAQNILTEWWADVRGDKGTQASLAAIAYAVAYIIAAVIGILLLGWLYRMVVKLKVWGRVWDRLFAKRHASMSNLRPHAASACGKGFTEHRTGPLNLHSPLECPGGQYHEI